MLLPELIETDGERVRELPGSNWRGAAALDLPDRHLVREERGDTRDPLVIVIVVGVGHRDDARDERHVVSL